MKALKALSSEQATVETAAIFDKIKQHIGRVPNLYAAIGNSSNLLEGFLHFGESLKKGVFSSKEQEAIALAVSQVNKCAYCLSAHTAMAKMHGFSEEETMQLRDGTIEDNKLNALTNLASEITLNRGDAPTESIERFFAVGYTATAFAELIGLIALRIITNYIYHNGDFAIDFPKAKFIEDLVAA